MKPWWIFRIGKFIAILIVASLVLGLAVMVLWNAMVPALFGGPSLTFWQAVGLLLLSHLLLRGWGPWRHGNVLRHERWKSRFEEKLAAMTPEEREKFREEYRKRCGPRWTEESGQKEQTKL